MKIGPLLFVLLGVGLIGWSMYEIDSPYFTLAVGILVVLIGFGQMAETSTPDDE